MDLQPAGVVTTFLDTLDLTLTLTCLVEAIDITNDFVPQTSNYTASQMEAFKSLMTISVFILIFSQIYRVK